MEYLFLASLWIIWCIVHSTMISLALTGYLKNKLGHYFRFYRFFYNTLAISTFSPLVHYGGAIKAPLLFRWEGYMIILQLFLVAIGVLLVVLGWISYDILHLMGFRQIKTGSSNSYISKTGNFDTSGILGVTRHPWYLAAIILLWTGYRTIYVTTLIVGIILTFYLLIGTILEERKLLHEYGDEYRRYQKNVSMLIPFKWFHSIIRNFRKTRV